MEKNKSCNTEELPYTVLRCPLVRNNTHQCRALCTPIFGYGLCGRRAAHGPKPLPGQEQQVVLYVIPKQQIA